MVTRNAYVLLPCSGSETWAVPQGCLGEIVTVPATGRRPPAQISWRGREIPVLDCGSGGGGGWCDARGEAGLVAVLLALQDVPGTCWGVALGSEGPGLVELGEADIEPLPEAVAEHAVTAFRVEGAVCQVPDLAAWQAALAT
jgi:hypothetical protein